MVMQGCVLVAATPLCAAVDGAGFSGLISLGRGSSSSSSHSPSLDYIEYELTIACPPEANSGTGGPRWRVPRVIQPSYYGNNGLQSPIADVFRPSANDSGMKASLLSSPQSCQNKSQLVAPP
jgi:hypothetical protein